VLPSNIAELLTPVAIAFWAAWDGYYQKDVGVSWLCTDSLTPDEVDLLRSILLSKYGIKSSIGSSFFKSGAIPNTIAKSSMATSRAW